MSSNPNRNGGPPKITSSIDIDKRSNNSRASHISAGTSSTQREPSYDDPPPPASRLRRVIDSFKQEDRGSNDGKQGRSVDSNGIEQMHLEDGIMMNPVEGQSRLARHLKGRHLQMIAIGGSIGQSPVSLATGSAKRRSRKNANSISRQALVSSLLLAKHFRLVAQPLSSSPSLSSE